jgi:lactaldehyde dehydrogenase
MVTNPLINKISFTGSIPTGVSIVQKAGMKKAYNGTGRK